MKSIACLIMMALFCLPSTAFAASRVALVIGNGAYSNARLRNPVNDAKGIAAALKRLDFDVMLITDADKRTMKQAISDFGHKLGSADIRFFYFAGHGMQVRGENFLIPVRSEVMVESDVEFESVNAARILGNMRNAGPGVNIVMLDACRNNPFASNSFRSSSRGLAKMDAPTGSLIVYATAPGSVAADGSGNNGLFTEHLLKHIERKGVALDDVVRDVRGGVAKASSGRQVPWASESLLSAVYLNGSMVANGSTEFVSLATGPVVPVARAETERDVRIAKLDASIEEMESRLINGTFRQGDSLSAMKELIDQRGAEQKKSYAVGLAAFMAEVAAYEQIVNSKHKDSMGPAAWKVLVSKYPVAATDIAFGDVQAIKAAYCERAFSSGDIWRDPTTGMEFVWVPGGCYQMGSNHGDSDEKPVHEVCVDGFWMGKYEVTQAQWKQVMGGNPSYFKGDRNPVEQVSWRDARFFIKKLNGKGNGTFRLPTEAEWEYAARSGGKNEKYAGGNSVDHVAWYDGNSGNKTHPVGTKAPNGLGLHDMSGNVWEWCEDTFSKSAYSSHSRNNPIYSGGGDCRVLRGGGWFNGPGDVRSARRGGDGPGCTSDNIGFRLLRTN